MLYGVPTQQNMALTCTCSLEKTMDSQCLHDTASCRGCRAGTPGQTGCMGQQPPPIPAQTSNFSLENSGQYMVLGGRKLALDTSPEGQCRRACCRGDQNIANFGMSALLMEAGNHCSEKETSECQGLPGLPGSLIFFSNQEIFLFFWQPRYSQMPHSVQVHFYTNVSLPQNH